MVALGVLLTVVLHAWLTGVIGDSIEFTARFSTGHVKVMTSAYAENITSCRMILPCWMQINFLIRLKRNFRKLSGASGSTSAGLVDVPDISGETRAQGNAVGFGIDLLSGNSAEIDRMNIRKSVRQGRLPGKKERGSAERIIVQENLKSNQEIQSA